MKERLRSAVTPLCFSSRLQDDVVMGTLTVRENLNFSAALRLPGSIPQDEKEQMVDKLIQELGLSRVANSKVRMRRRSRNGQREIKSLKKIKLALIIAPVEIELVLVSTVGLRMLLCSKIRIHATALTPVTCMYVF